MDEYIEIEAIVKGWVQGVGFRRIAKTHAERLGINGTVKNMPDGTVLIRATGKRADIDLLFQILRHKAGAADVTEILTKAITPPTPYHSFDII